MFNKELTPVITQLQHETLEIKTKMGQ